jgi:hypothetical protein
VVDNHIYPAELQIDPSETEHDQTCRTEQEETYLWARLDQIPGLVTRQLLSLMHWVAIPLCQGVRSEKSYKKMAHLDIAPTIITCKLFNRILVQNTRTA